MVSVTLHDRKDPIRAIRGDVCVAHGILLSVQWTLISVCQADLISVAVIVQINIFCCHFILFGLGPQVSFGISFI